ncbi:transposon polyprotein (fragment), putative [Candida dubliniensis CD36]|uniref:Retrotransposon tca3-like polyprotein, putative n=1 Tax=Candida dubliniensis (strain CD36 / ATCC MYA-646 / CBS 7987 / NCPF 3949 / NRRL Y-17841) TaxID=573826 RepID=B9W8T6_CANDC
MARNQKKQEQESVPETPATTSSAAEQAAGQTIDQGPEAQMFVTADQFAEFRQQVMEMFKQQSETITNQIYKVINETNAAQAEAIAVNRERENVLDEQAKRIVEGAQEKFDHVDEHVDAQAEFIQATAQKVDELAAKMEKQRSNPTFGHDNDAPPGQWNVPPTADHAFGPPPSQAYGAPPNEFGFEPYEDEPSPVSPREIAAQIRRVMPTFMVQAFPPSPPEAEFIEEVAMLRLHELVVKGKSVDKHNDAKTQKMAYQKMMSAPFGIPANFQKGQWVYRRRKKSAKNQYNFDGPFLIEEVRNNNSYIISRNGKREKGTYHHDMLKPAFALEDSPITALSNFQKSMQEIEHRVLGKMFDEIKVRVIMLSDIMKNRKPVKIDAVMTHPQFYERERVML